VLEKMRMNKFWLLTLLLIVFLIFCAFHKPGAVPPKGYEGLYEAMRKAHAGANVEL